MIPDRSPLGRIQDFFAPRAHGWDERFAHDSVQFSRAVLDVAPASGSRVLDAGCGTSRAMPYLKQSVGSSGQVVGLDATREMLVEGARLGRLSLGYLVQSDVEHLPFLDREFDLIFAGGLIPHLGEPEQALTEFARIIRPGGRLAIFHALGRVALARRHGGVPADDDAIAPGRLTGMLATTGWTVDLIDDAEERFLVLAHI